MKNIIDYVKEKSYYFLGGTVIIIILLIVITSCSGSLGGSSYESIEYNMTNAAKSYYEQNSNLLPKQEGGSVKVTISSLVEAELLNEIKDPNNTANSCTGYVEVIKVDNDYSYIPFLTCEGNYEPKYLSDKIKESDKNYLGDGVYEINGEYIYRGEDVNNYIKFNDMLWRIVKVDNDGDIKIILDEYLDESYEWDSKYNSEKQLNSGNTSNYLITDIRRNLNKYFEKTITKDNKAKVVSKNLCVGKYSEGDEYNLEKECAIIAENEKIGLLNAIDYHNASLDDDCVTLENRECSNRNYLTADSISTWLLASAEENTYEVYMLYTDIERITASSLSRINPVIYLSNKVITNAGEGTKENPYIVK